MPRERRARRDGLAGEDDRMKRLRQCLTPGRGQARLRWNLTVTAPEWLRRIWGGAARPVPRMSAADRARLRRIAYL
jgi:hypothetical protein